MMVNYRFSITNLDNDIVVNDINHSIRKLLIKWLGTEISVPILESGLRIIVKDPPTFTDIKKVLFLEMIKRSIYRSSDFKDAYREIQVIMIHISNYLEISTEEAMLILESGITNVKLLVNHIDIVTILNEREVYGM